MAKQGMKRPEVTHEHHHNQAADVGMIQGKAKHGHVRANPIIAGTRPPSQKVYHTEPYAMSSLYPTDAMNSLGALYPYGSPNAVSEVYSASADALIYGDIDEPISNAYPAIDNDLARDNLQNDIPDADLNDL
ncbi:MAG: hypothetical protein Q4F95_10170 [Oscillospiraceae bacterium]|nr:hypothetical protein [Oscillospiraceae bacterium]